MKVVNRLLKGHQKPISFSVLYSAIGFVALTNTMTCWILQNKIKNACTRKTAHIKDVNLPSSFASCLDHISLPPAPTATLRRRCITILTIWHHCTDQTQTQLVYVPSQLRSLTFRAVMYASCWESTGAQINAHLKWNLQEQLRFSARQTQR